MLDRTGLENRIADYHQRACATAPFTPRWQHLTLSRRYAASAGFSRGWPGLLFLGLPVDRPWLPFFTRDWRSDLNLRAVSPAARGLWIDLICLMHEGQPYGHLSKHSVPIPPADAALMLGYSSPLFNDLLSELERGGVADRDSESGAIFSRRMVRDEHLRAARSAAGKSGAKATNQRFAAANDASVAGAGVTRQRLTSDSDSNSGAGKEKKGHANGKIPAQYRSAVEYYTRDATSPSAVWQTIQASITGMHPPQYGWEVVGVALQDMAAAGVIFSPRRFRAFCRGATEPEKKPPLDDMDAVIERLKAKDRANGIA